MITDLFIWTCANPAWVISTPLIVAAAGTLVLLLADIDHDTK